MLGKLQSFPSTPILQNRTAGALLRGGTNMYGGTTSLDELFTTSSTATKLLEHIGNKTIFSNLNSWMTKTISVSSDYTCKEPHFFVCWRKQCILRQLSTILGSTNRYLHWDLEKFSKEEF